MDPVGLDTSTPSHAECRNWPIVDGHDDPEHALVGALLQAGFIQCPAAVEQLAGADDDIEAIRCSMR